VPNLLVVDVGNTNLVLGIYRGDQLVNSWRLATARERTFDEDVRELKQIHEQAIVRRLAANG